LFRGAFKIRGASNSIFALDDEQASNGVVTHSRYDASFSVLVSIIFKISEEQKHVDMMVLLSGNHAAAVALAAKLRGIPAHIVIPRNAPACKVENVRRYGGQIVWSDANMESRESVCKRVQEETSAVLIHPFNNKYTIRCVLNLRSFKLEMLPTHILFLDRNRCCQF
jgi:serine racemase